MIDLFLPIVGADYPKQVIPLISTAKKNIDIVVYDWRWYANQPAHSVQRFNIALINAVKRGVEVRAVVNHGTFIPLFNKVGIKARQIKSKRVVHSKFIIIDNEILIIGSHNFTRNAFGSNIETSLALTLPKDQTRFFEFFNNLYNI